MITSIVLMVYAGLFAWHAYKSEQKQWLMGAIVLGLGSAWLMSNLLPGFVYNHFSALIYLLPLWVSLSSLFFFVGKWRYHSATKVFYAEPPCSPYLVYLAVSGMMMHLAWLIPLLWSSYQYPNGLSFYSSMSLGQLYLLQPLYWIVAQWCLMLILHLAQAWHRSPVVLISVTQLQFSFLFSLLAVSVYLISDFTNYYVH